jgi:hypothetical protein
VTSLRFPAAGRGVYVASILVMALAVSVGWWAAALRPDTRPALTSALDVVPFRTNVVGFTDWAQIREQPGLDAAARRDLTTRSLIDGSVENMGDVLGWSSADVEWEVYGQDPSGAASVVRLDRSVSFDDVREKLRSAGFRQDGPVWGAAESARLPEIFNRVALVPRQRLLVLSGQRAQMSRVLDVIDGKARSLAASHAAGVTAQALAGSHSVILQGGTLGCGTTAVTGDDAREQQARAAVDRAGALEPYLYSGRGVVDAGGSGFAAQRVVFAMTFDSAVDASEQAQVRARLATGPFIGRTGQTDETLRLRSAIADEATVRLDFAHDPDTDVFMTGTGPVLFATCDAG